MSTITPIPSSIGNTLPDSASKLSGHAPVAYLVTPTNPVNISTLGRSLAVQSSQRADKNVNTNNKDKDLPEAIKAMLTMIRELHTAQESKLQELREIQADKSLTPAQSKERTQKVQTMILGLGHSLINATQSLSQSLSGDTLTDDQKMQAATQAIR